MATIFALVIWGLVGGPGQASGGDTGMGASADKADYDPRGVRAYVTVARSEFPLSARIGLETDIGRLRPDSPWIFGAFAVLGENSAFLGAGSEQTFVAVGPRVARVLLAGRWLAVVAGLNAGLAATNDSWSPGLCLDLTGQDCASRSTSTQGLAPYESATLDGVWRLGRVTAAVGIMGEGVGAHPSIGVRAGLGLLL